MIIFYYYKLYKGLDVFSILGHLTNGTSISQVMTLLSLLNNVHHIQGDIQALPNDVVNAINQLSSLIGVTASNLTAILTGAKPTRCNLFFYSFLIIYIIYKFVLFFSK